MNRPSRKCKEDVDYNLYNKIGKRIIKAAMANLDDLTRDQLGHINELSEFEKDNPIEDLDDIVEANNCFDEFTKLVNVLKKMSCGAQKILGDEYAERFPDIETIYGKKRDFSKTIKARGRAIKRHLNEEAEQRALGRENRNREFELNVKMQELEHATDLEAKRLRQARELGEKRATSRTPARSAEN